MNKNAIKKFAIDARNKLIASVTDKAAMLGITPDNCSEAITKGADFEVYKTAAGTEVTLNKKQCEQRRKLVDQIHARGFETVVEEVAYTWFNRICAIRFMEVNDYMYPVRVRVLSSEKEGKNEPDVVTMAPDIDWDFTDKEREEIIDAKMNNRLDDLFRMLFIKQCNLLHEVLPGLFEETEDYTEMLLNISFTNEDDVIRMLVDGIDEKDFNITTVDEDGKAAGQVEIIGWLYQYYNTEPKNKAFAKKAKITKEEIPAVTQLFTPDWIVRYMVENSLGRMWVEGHPDDELKSKWKYYLDEAKQEESVQQELDKIKAEYATLKPEDIKLIDPCMGSGHILVYAFDVFMQIYENAGWSQRDAAQSIIQNNIYGLDIDDRAAQLSYFAVLMKARQYDRRILTRGIEPNVYAVQEGNGISRGQLKYFGAGLTDTEKNVAVSQMEGLLNTLNDAKEYGSLLNMEDYDWELLEKFVENTDTESQISFDTFGLDETAEQLKQLIRIGKVMAQKYEVVATNPPYAGTSNLSAKVNNFVKKNYPDSKADLFAVFIERCGEMLKKNGYQAMITQHVGIITPYAAQVRLIRAMLRDYYAKDIPSIRCATVHQFQGSESDVIVFDAVESYPKGAVGYLMGKEPNQVTRLINVAITRGKGKVIVVANARFWENIFKGRNHVFYRLLQHIKNKNHQVVEYQDKTLQPYVESINPGKVVDIFVDEQDAIAKFEQDMLKAKWKVVISLPSGALRETENQVFKLIDDADSRGVDILMKSNDYASLPQYWKNYCRGTENATFPLIIIDDEVSWYGLPTANWKFDVDKTTSLKTVVYMMVRFKGKNTVEMLKALTDIETVAIGVNTRKLLKKDNNMVTHPMASSSGVVVPDDGKSAYGLAGFVEEKEFCPACKSHMVLTKNARGTAYLKCSNKACKETKYLTVDLMNWYISSHNVGCPKHDGGELKGRLGKYGPYVTCTCGHTLKPHDI